jgi:hypothetical protein
MLTQTWFLKLLQRLRSDSENDGYMRPRSRIFRHEFRLQNEDATVSASMKTYLEEAISESELQITKLAATPAKKYLFEIDETLPVLDKREAEVFHSIVAKLLYVATRARPDILLAISFLCKRVARPLKQDQQKLQRL